MGRLVQAFTKASQLAQQFDDEIKRANDQQQQQQPPAQITAPEPPQPTVGHTHRLSQRQQQWQSQRAAHSHAPKLDTHRESLPHREDYGVLGKSDSRQIRDGRQDPERLDTKSPAEDDKEVPLAAQAMNRLNLREPDSTILAVPPLPPCNPSMGGSFIGEQPPIAQRKAQLRSSPIHVSGVLPVTQCVDSPVSIPLEWAFHLEASCFAVCTRCYVDHIHDSCFRNAFEIRSMSDGVPRRCLFGVSRMKTQLWPRALRQADLSEVLDFMLTRQALEHCPSMAFVKGRSWYTTTACSALAICEACFIERIAGGSFASHFMLDQPQASGVSCDMAVPYINRLYELCIDENEWNTFIAEAAVRIRMQPCPKQEVVEASTLVWYGTDDFNLCFTCYCDYFVDTESSDRFKHTQIRSGKMRCAFGDLNILLLIQEATSQKDHGIFWKGMTDVTRTPWCDPAGIMTSIWHGLPNGDASFAVCERCMVCIAKPAGAEGFFVRQSQSSSRGLKICAFNGAHPRFAFHMSALMESILRGSPLPLEDLTTKLSGVPACPGLNYDAGKNKRWWGWDHATICEECYVTFAEALGMENHYDFNGQRQSMPMCDLYSPRMRSLYRQACQTENVSSFLNAAKHRRQVFIEAYLPAQRMEQQLLIAAEEAQMYGIMGTAYKSMGWSQAAVMGHNYTLGNAQLGYGHINELAFEGASYDLRSANARAQVMHSGNWQVIEQLKTTWALVE